MTKVRRHALHWRLKLLVLFLLGGCDAAPTAGVVADTAANARETPGSGCKVASMGGELERAICKASPLMLDQALNPVGASARERGERLAAAIPVLERLWRGDRSLGQGLPWNELTQPRFRSALVQYLAQAVRNGQSQLTLKELQEFAVDYSVADIPKGVVLGIRLIGLTDAPGQLPVLEHAVRQGANEGQQVEAVLALGNLCDPAAEKLLLKLQNDSSLPEKVRGFVAVGLSMKEQNSKSWCRQR